jgi:hypothetical protein
MIKKYSSFLLAFCEIGLFLLLTPIVFLKVFWLIGPIECNNSGLLSVVIFVISIMSITVILKLRIIKSVYVKIAATWAILTLSASAIWCLRVPFVMGVP